MKRVTLFQKWCYRNPYRIVCEARSDPQNHCWQGFHLLFSPYFPISVRLVRIPSAQNLRRDTPRRPRARRLRWRHHSKDSTIANCRSPEVTPCVARRVAHLGQQVRCFDAPGDNDFNFQKNRQKLSSTGILLLGLDGEQSSDTRCTPTAYSDTKRRSQKIERPKLRPISCTVAFTHRSSVFHLPGRTKSFRD